MQHPCRVGAVNERRRTNKINKDPCALLRVTCYPIIINLPSTTIFYVNITIIYGIDNRIVVVDLPT